MFSLIITLVSIALVTALALATIYYGGEAFRQGSADAKAARLINEGQQIQGAFSLAKVNNLPMATLGDLTPAYFVQLPQGWAPSQPLTTSTTNLARPIGSRNVPQVLAHCQAINVKAGFTAADTASTTDTDTNLVVTAADAQAKGATFYCASIGVQKAFFQNLN